MAKLALAQQRTRPATEECQHVQSTLGHSTTAVCSLPFIQPVCNEAGETHDDYDAQVACGGNSHVLVFAFRSVPCFILRQPPRPVAQSHAPRTNRPTPSPGPPAPRPANCPCPRPTPRQSNSSVNGPVRDGCELITGPHDEGLRKV